MGVGEAVKDGSSWTPPLEDLATITGQKPVVTKARKSIAGFKLREGMAIGAKVTLRGARMWEFLDRLVSMALPRIRDFRGLSPKAFDGHGNYTIGVTEQLIFPEIDYDKVVKVTGHGHHDRDDGDDRRRGTSAARRPGLPVRPGRAAERAGELRGRDMAKKALINKQKSSRSSGCAATRGAAVRPLAGGLPQFLLCRICFRELAHLGEMPGVTKASW